MLFRSVRSNCSEAICLAARTLFLEAFLRTAVIFVKCRKVSTRTTLPNFIDLSAETALYSRFGGHNGGVGRKGKREGVRLQFDSPGQRTRFSRATKKVLACSHSHSLQLLCTAGGNQAKSDVHPPLWRGLQNFKFATRIRPRLVATNCTWQL